MNCKSITASQLITVSNSVILQLGFVGLGCEVLVGVWEDGFVRIAVVEMVMGFIGWRFGDWWREFGQSGGVSLVVGYVILWILGFGFWRRIGGMVVEACGMYVMEKELKILTKELTSEIKAIFYFSHELAA
jgi:hypothetical protein